MAGMQRFVTYLYSYKGNEKLQNTGFAKVEIRGGQCRLEIHLKGALSLEKEPKVYLFSREGEKIYAVEIGSLSLSDGGGDCRVMLPSGRIAGSPYSIFDMKGIFIPLDGNVMFASQWDEGGIARERIRIWKEEEEAAEISGKQNGEPIKTESDETVTETGDDKTVTEAGSEETIRETVSVETVTESGSDEAATEGGSGETVTEAASVQATELPVREQAAGEEPSQTTLLDCFLKLQKRVQTVEIFETGKRQVSGIHIELRDIRELPRKFWNLGNNSFLLHGFFNYHYLLLGKRTEGETETIFIGVPGVFHSPGTYHGVPLWIFGISSGTSTGGESEPGNCMRLIPRSSC